MSNETFSQKIIKEINTFYFENKKTIKIIFIIIAIVIVIIIILNIYFLYTIKSNTEKISEINNQKDQEEIDKNLTPDSSYFPKFTEKEDSTLKREELIEDTLISKDFEFYEDYKGEAIAKEIITPIELRPVAGYTILNKKASIKEFIKNKPTVCEEKFVASDKNLGTIAIENLQKTLKSFPGTKPQSITGKIDETTKNNLYIIQTRYNKIIYQNSKDKTQTRKLDKETAHFLNILCGFEKELDNEYVLIPILRYAIKENGEIFELNLKTKEKFRLKTEKMKNTEEAIFSLSGIYAILRAEDAKGSIITKIIDFRNNSVEQLENDIKTIDISNDNIIAYGVKKNNNLDIKIYDLSTKKLSLLSSVPLTEWFIQWREKNKLRITSKPSGLTEGISMTLNEKEKRFEQDISPMLGLNTKNLNNNKHTLVQVGGVGTSKLLILNNNTKELSSLEIESFIEKCSNNIMRNGIFCAVPNLINKTNLIPDDWYKERLHTNDKIVYINFQGGEKINIANLNDFPMSVKDLNVSSAGIFFINSKNQALYALSIKQ